jgi:hypothetical protein
MNQDSTLIHTVGIIIATCARPAELEATLISIRCVVVPSDVRLDVFVVENGAKSGVEEVVGRVAGGAMTFHYLYCAEPNKSKALNFALGQVRSEFLIFTDDDVRVPTNWIEEMCRPLITGEGEVVVGGCRLAEQLQRSWMTSYHRAFLASTEYLDDKAPSEFAGVNFACIRVAFDMVSGFDPELGGGGLGNAEDSLLARQFRLAGLRFVSRTNVLLEHHPRMDRLLYVNWLKAARNTGCSIAYLMHHWQHDDLSIPVLRGLYYKTKLFLRSIFFGRLKHDREGISAWELSYRVDIAKMEWLAVEVKRPRNYARHGRFKTLGTRIYEGTSRDTSQGS